MSRDWEEKLPTRALQRQGHLISKMNLPIVRHALTHIEELPTRALGLEFKDGFADSDTLTHTHTHTD